MAQKRDNITLLRNLNAEQRKAVEHVDGPNLILAGAGSGKTRVLTHKIGYLIERKKSPPQNILAMTFTNKAANEMKERVVQLIKGDIRGLWIGTFHANFARILRKNCEKLGYSYNFAIYDESDQLSLIKAIIKDLDILPASKVSPKGIHSKIKFLKNANVTFDEFEKIYQGYVDESLRLVYSHYTKRLKDNNAMDFEDLLLKSIELFTLFPAVLAYYQNMFRYLLVDEYQDTNRLQYDLLKLLSAQYRNISVVGDDDQSIYQWRGADIRNILEFEKDFPECTIFRLEQNYRSTTNILKVAHSIISHNVHRMDKELWTKNDCGEKICLKIATDAYEETNFIIQKIESEIQLNQRNFSDFAILYRINAQSRVIEMALKNSGINYVIIGGVRFYARKEIKDVLAYLKVLVNPKDSISLRRIINYPQRGIGAATFEKIEKYSLQKNISVFEAMKKINEIDSISQTKRQGISEFIYLIEKYLQLKSSISTGELIPALIDDLGILSDLKKEGTHEAYNRIENIRELMFSINEFIKQNPELTLENYLENVALISDIDSLDNKANAVSLITLHSAKGLEFPVVFITGLEEGLLPLARQMAYEHGLEEERRLFYVGVTRAKEKLYLSAAKFRRQPNDNSNGSVSRFLNEIDKSLIEIDRNSYHHASPASRDTQTAKSIIEMENSNQSTARLKPGMLVRHPRFGTGVIRKVDGIGEEVKAYILFEELGEKIIKVKFCKLEILS